MNGDAMAMEKKEMLVPYQFLNCIDACRYLYANMERRGIGWCCAGIMNRLGGVTSKRRSLPV